jgi:hypothetical protein
MTRREFIAVLAGAAGRRTPWLSGDRVLPCLDLEDETG